MYYILGLFKIENEYVWVESQSICPLPWSMTWQLHDDPWSRSQRHRIFILFHYIDSFIHWPLRFSPFNARPVRSWHSQQSQFQRQHKEMSWNVHKDHFPPGVNKGSSVQIIPSRYPFILAKHSVLSTFPSFMQSCHASIPAVNGGGGEGNGSVISPPLLRLDRQT